MELPSVRDLMNPEHCDPQSLPSQFVHAATTLVYVSSTCNFLIFLTRIPKSCSTRRSRDAERRLISSPATKRGASPPTSPSCRSCCGRRRLFEHFRFSSDCVAKLAREQWIKRNRARMRIRTSGFLNQYSAPVRDLEKNFFARELKIVLQHNPSNSGHIAGWTTNLYLLALIGVMFAYVLSEIGFDLRLWWASLRKRQRGGFYLPREPPHRL